mgnify:CR=1 FL=1
MLKDPFLHSRYQLQHILGSGRTGVHNKAGMFGRNLRTAHLKSL